VFYAFRAMVGTGMLMLAVAWFAAWLIWRRGGIGVWTARGLAAMTLSGWVATLAGWYVTEIGRQPWLVTGVLATADAASDVPVAMIGSSLAIYLLLYAGLIAAYVSVLFHLAGKPAAAMPEDAPKGKLIAASAAARI
jgi:cytochrome d ubiquinol oxidase subunit I